MQRVKEIDLLKAFGILLMIMGHQYYGKGFDHWIHAFHMPIFFVISGFLYKKRGMKKTVISRFRSLLIPYLFYALFHLAIICCVNLRDGIVIRDSLPRYLYHLFLFNHESMPICGAIWFLTALFITEMLYHLIDSIAVPYLRLTTVAITTGVGLSLSASRIILPFSSNAALVGVGLFYLGHWLRMLYEKYEYKGNVWFGMIGVAVCLITIFENQLVNVRLSIYGNVLLFFFNAVFMTFSLFNIVVKLTKYENCFVKEIEFIGKNSIVYLGFNQLVLIFLKNIQFENVVANTIYKCAALVICLIVLHLITCFLSRTKLKILIGK